MARVMVAGDSPLAMLQTVVPPFRSRAILGKPSGAALAPLVEAVAAGDLRVKIDHRLPLREAEEAHRLSQTGRLTGNIVLLPRG